MGEAAYGKNTTGTRLFHVRARKGSSEQPRNNVSRYRAEKENWIYIPVPAIIDNNLFDAVQEQIAENKKRARSRKTGATYLLQGLLVCKYCGLAYCGSRIARPYKSVSVYFYYRCAGTEAARFGGNKLCNNKAVRTQAIELIVWEEIKKVLKDPQRVYAEYQRRLVEINSAPIDDSSVSLEKRKIKLEKGISLLIDSYAQQYITKDEFEPRVKSMKNDLKVIQEHKNKLMEQKNLAREVELAINSLESFISGVITNLDSLDWLGKRDIIRRVVKRIEIGHEEIKIVYKINKLSSQKENLNLQHCSNGITYTSC
jgi:site-specific DNA recombinase